MTFTLQKILKGEEFDSFIVIVRIIIGDYR